MPKQTSSTRRMKVRPQAKAAAIDNFDGVYLFKMVLYLLLGSLWLRIGNGEDLPVPLPIGLIIGIIFAMHEHFRIDRKIEYAVLLVAMLFGYFGPYGIYIVL